MTADRKRHWKRVVSLVVVVGGLLAFGVWFNLFRTRASAAQPSLQDEFLYGSMGSEADEGTPYWIWVILPKLFPEYLPGPGGYASIGLTWNEGRELPAGVTTRLIGFERVGVNCAFCHVSAVRFTADQGKPTFYPGGPGHQVRVQEYQDFLFKSAADPRFNADRIMSEISAVTKLSTREALLYRYLLIPMTKRALLEQREQFAWEKLRPAQGPGRIDPFNPIRFRVFKQPDDRSIGNSDMPSIWNQNARVGHFLHADGLTKVFHETLITSAIGDGAREDHIDLPYLTKIERYLRELPSPAYPLPIDRTLAARGAPLFKQECGECHAPGGAKTGTVIPATEIGTDDHRTQSWTQGQVDDWKKLSAEYRQKYGAKWNLDSFNKQSGYVTGLLDGVWLKGPYLHNGSVPSLSSLLDAPDARPRVFYRGNDLFDAVGVGYVSTIPSQGSKHFFQYDVSVAGNSNAGHVYGTQLPADDKQALVEYMKTL
jgi:mono/diheme cytochrome c family protein